MHKFKVPFKNTLSETLSAQTFFDSECERDQVKEGIQSLVHHSYNLRHSTNTEIPSDRRWLRAKSSTSHTQGHYTLEESFDGDRDFHSLTRGNHHSGMSNDTLGVQKRRLQCRRAQRRHRLKKARIIQGLERRLAATEAILKKASNLLGDWHYTITENISDRHPLPFGIGRMARKTQLLQGEIETKQIAADQHAGKEEADQLEQLTKFPGKEFGYIVVHDQSESGEDHSNGAIDTI